MNDSNKKNRDTDEKKEVIDATFGNTMEERKTDYKENNLEVQKNETKKNSKKKTKKKGSETLICSQIVGQLHAKN